MSEGKKAQEEVIWIQFRLHIMKALGWYISIHKDIKQKEIAEKMGIDPSALSYAIIPPKDALSITEENYHDHNKRLIDISRAMEICKYMNTTLQNVLYYYQFEKILGNSDKIDSLEKLTNQLTNLENVPEKLTQITGDTVEPQQGQNPSDFVQISANNIISDINHPDFTPWFGKYYCYFSSTSSEEAGKKRQSTFEKVSDDPELQELLECSTEEYIFCGIMNVHDRTAHGDGLCHVDFKFLANPVEKSIKRYSGILMLSKTTKAVFCELTSNEQGEKTYLILEKQDLGKEQPHVRCCMAMVLTYSSKVNRRRPCCERMIISNSRIKEGSEEYEAMKAYLRMNDSTIRITQWGYNELIKDLNHSDDPEIRQIAELFPELHSLKGQNVTIENCAFIPESIIYTLNKLSDSQQRKFEILLRNHSIAPWYSKTKATKADTLFYLLNSLHD